MKNKDDINTILARPCNRACGPYGADMGRRDNIEGNPEKLLLQRMRMVDGDYDTGGAYWGGTAGAMYCAFSADSATTNEIPVMVFVRARSREEAKVLVLEKLPGEGWGFFK